MKQKERRNYLISGLLNEQPQYKSMKIPKNIQEQKMLLRALFNVRIPRMVSNEFLRVQDDYLREEISKKGIVKISDLQPIQKGIYLWQGDYGLFQCQTPCKPYTYENEAQVKRMIEEQKDMRIPTELIPKCPICGKPMTMNLRADATFVQDEGWNIHASYYEKFLNTHKKSNILFLELGVGYNTPGIIKYPFWQMTARNRNAEYICINKGEVFVPIEIKARSTEIDADIYSVIKELVKE